MRRTCPAINSSIEMYPILSPYNRVADSSLLAVLRDLASSISSSARSLVSMAYPFKILGPERSRPTTHREIVSFSGSVVIAFWGLLHQINPFMKFSTSHPLNKEDPMLSLSGSMEVSQFLFSLTNLSNLTFSFPGPVRRLAEVAACKRPRG